jgi:serine/threonine-protein phosphatase CPPED1
LSVSGLPVPRFMLVADPQFGVYEAISKVSDKVRPLLERQGLRLPYTDRIEGFEREIELFSEVVEAANRIQPDFVVVCGDMVQKWDDTVQADAIQQLAMKLTAPCYWVAGNHDVAEDALTPTPRSLATYRQRFGRDYYSFDYRGTRFVVLNSTVLLSQHAVPDEFAANVSFLTNALDSLKSDGCERCIVFSHHPWFLDDPEDTTDYPIPMAVPPAARHELLQLVDRPEVMAVFAGHTHRTQQARHGQLKMVQTVAASLPFSDEPAGYRIVDVFEDGLEHFGVTLASGAAFAWESRRLEHKAGTEAPG